MSGQPKSKEQKDMEHIPFDDALRKMLSAPPAPKVKPKPQPKQKKKTGQ